MILIGIDCILYNSVWNSTAGNIDTAGKLIMDTVRSDDIIISISYIDPVILIRRPYVIG